ncbi:hypothetical protein OROMI_028832 [Orobanche minor]
MSTNIDIQESSKSTKGKAVLVTAPARPGGWKKGIAIMDFILRLGAIAAALGAAATMRMSDQTLTFFTQFFQFEASYDSFTAFHCHHSPSCNWTKAFLRHSRHSVFLTLPTASAASAAAIVYLAHNGNQDTNCLAICNQFGDFCAQTSEAVVSSFITMVVLVMLIVMSALAIGKHRKLRLSYEIS